MYRGIARTLAISLVLFFALTAHSKAKKQKELPAVFRNARFVYVESFNGDEFNPRVNPNDRHAIYNVQQELKDWKRYSLAMERKDAELVFVVRAGRLAGADARVGVNVGRPVGSRMPSNPDPASQDPSQTSGQQGTRIGGGADVGSPDDQLEVYLLSPSGDLNGPVWSNSKEDGLVAPEMPLFRQLKREVDTAYPRS